MMYDTMTRQRAVGRSNHQMGGYQGEVQIHNIAQENKDGFYQIIPVHHNNTNRSWYPEMDQANNTYQQQSSSFNTGRRSSRRHSQHRRDQRTEQPLRYEPSNNQHQQHHHSATRQVKSHDGYQTMKPPPSHRSNKSAPAQTIRSPPSIISEQPIYTQPQNVYSQPKRYNQEPQHRHNENHVIFHRKQPIPPQPQPRHHKQPTQEIPYEHFNIQPIVPPQYPQQTFQAEQNIPIQHEWEMTPDFMNTLQRSNKKQEQVKRKTPSVYDQTDSVVYVTQKPPRPDKLGLVHGNSVHPPTNEQQLSPLRKQRTPSMTFGDDFKISLDQVENEKMDTFRLRKTGNGSYNWESQDKEGKGLPFPTDDQLNMMLNNGQRTIRSSLKKSSPSGRHGTVRKRVTIQERVPSYQALLFP